MNNVPREMLILIYSHKDSSSDIFLHKLAMKLGADGVIDKVLLFFSLVDAFGAVLEDHVVVPAPLHLEICI